MRQRGLARRGPVKDAAGGPVARHRAHGEPPGSSGAFDATASRESA